FWLQQGDNHFGSDPAASIVLPEHAAPREAGLFRVQGREVTVVAARGAPLTFAGRPVTEMKLRSDAPGPPDVLALGPLRLFVIERSGRLAIRMRDLTAPARQSFRGLRWFPIRPEYRIVGRFLPYPAPKQL